MFSPDVIGSCLYEKSLEAVFFYFIFVTIATIIDFGLLQLNINHYIVISNRIRIDELVKKNHGVHSTKVSLYFTEYLLNCRLISLECAGVIWEWEKRQTYIVQHRCPVKFRDDIEE